MIGLLGVVRHLSLNNQEPKKYQLKERKSEVMKNNESTIKIKIGKIL